MSVKHQTEETPKNLAFMPLGEFAKRILLLGGLIVAVLAIWQLRLVLLMTFLAIVIAVSLDIPVRKLQSYGLRRSLAILFVTVTAVGLLTLLAFSIGSPMVTQTQNLVEELPDAVETVGEEYKDLAEQFAFLPNVNFTGLGGASDPSSIVSSDTLTGGAVLVTSVGSFVISVLVNLILVVIVSMYLLADPQVYTNSLLALIPKRSQGLVLQILVDLRQALVGWLFSQLFSMTIMTILISFSLGVIWGIPNAIALGMLAGLLTFIPNFGPALSMIPGLIFTLSDSPQLLLPVFITYILMQQLEASFITPMIIKQRMNVPAAALLVFQVMVSVLFGFMGLLLAVPLFMVIMVLVRDLYVDYLLDNINTSVEARQIKDGETVLRVTSSHYSTQEIPLKQIFDGDGPFDRSLEEVMRSISQREQDYTREMAPVDLDNPPAPD
ncbi:MAG: AI-2E family transporter [Chloroflexi bacterium]|nr:AI-2E family transporter [Chloroflexota bacterium]